MEDLISKLFFGFIILVIIWPYYSLTNISDIPRSINELTEEVEKLRKEIHNGR